MRQFPRRLSLHVVDGVLRLAPASGRSSAAVRGGSSSTSDADHPQPTGEGKTGRPVLVHGGYEGETLTYLTRGVLLEGPAKSQTQVEFQPARGGEQ